MEYVDVGYHKDYYLKNKEKLIEYHKDYYLKNKEKLKERAKDYQKNNIDYVREYKKLYYKNNIDEILSKRKENYINDRHEILSIGKKYLQSFATPNLSAGIVPIEEVRKVDNLLQVKCTYCGKWFNPTILIIRNRKLTLIGKMKGESRFYCSESCKESCPIYAKKKYPEGFKNYYTREVQPELRKMVFERDNYTCQKCGRQDSLHCHHLEGIMWEPLESADIDKCITHCKNCHEEDHSKEGCKYYELKCIERSL